MSEIWLHPATMTIGVVNGDFIEFRFNGRKEESYWPAIKHGWRKIGYL
jgi:hypothetical protein